MEEAPLGNGSERVHIGVISRVYGVTGSRRVGIKGIVVFRIRLDQSTQTEVLLDDDV